MGRPAPVTLPKFSFDPTAQAADQKKDATGEAARPVGEAMQTLTTANRLPQSLADTVTIRHEPAIAEREYRKAYEWLEPRMSRGRREIFSELATITPSIAEVLLKGNPDNRNIKRTRLREIRADLENGNWVFNGESIIVSQDGLLNDGQHRLIAVRDSGISMKTMIVFGVARSSRLTLDQGTARTSADYLGMQGKNEEAAVVAAVSRMIWMYENQGSLLNGGGYVKSNKRYYPTKAEILGLAVDRELSIKRSIAAIGKSSRLVGSQSFVAFCHWLLSRVDDVAAQAFFERLIDGVGLSPESAIYVLRQRFINEPRMRPNTRLEAVIRAWNATRKGSQISKIQIMGTVPKIER